MFFIGSKTNWLFVDNALFSNRFLFAVIRLPRLKNIPVISSVNSHSPPLPPPPSPGKNRKGMKQLYTGLDIREIKNLINGKGLTSDSVWQFLNFSQFLLSSSSSSLDFVHSESYDFVILIWIEGHKFTSFCNYSVLPSLNKVYYYYYYYYH